MLETFLVNVNGVKLGKNEGIVLEYSDTSKQTSPKYPNPEKKQLYLQ